MAVEVWAKRLLISSTFTQATMYVVRPFITYRAIEIDAGATAIGLIGAIYALFPVLLALKFGSWVGKYGEGKFLVVGTFSLIVSCTSLLFTNNVPTLAIATALAGLSHLALMVGGQTMVALRAPKSDYNRLFGYYTFSASLGHTFGPVIAGLLAGSLANGMPEHSNYAFYFAILLSSIALIPTFKWRNNSPTVKAAEEQSNTWSAAKSMLSRKEISLAVFISMAISSTLDLLVIFLPLLGKERAIDPALIGLIISLRAVGSMGSRLILGKVSQHISDRALLLSTTTVSMLACVGMVYTNSAVILGALVFIAGFSSGFGQPLTMALISHRTKADERALAVSARLTGNRLGQFVLPVAAGLLANGAGVGAVFWSMAALLGASLVASAAE
jgi:MFS family permease